MKKGIAFLALVISLAFIPSLMAVGDTYPLKVWTEKSTYRVGEYWHGIVWDRYSECTRWAQPTSTLTIIGPSKYTLVNVTPGQLTTGNHLPSFGNPWTAADVGNWTLLMDINSAGTRCVSSGTAQFSVIA